jgi:hypothetical protein
MAEQSTFARRMMAQKLMAEKRDDPFSDSRFFAGKMRPSMDDIENPTRLSDMAGPAYGAAATGSLFVPGSGFADVFGGLANPSQPGEMLPSFGENIGQGKYLDAGLQTLGVAGDVLQAGGLMFPPLAAAGTMLKAPRAARVANAVVDADEMKTVLDLRADQMQLPVKDRLQPSGDAPIFNIENVPGQNQSPYERTLPQQVETPVPRAPDGVKLPLNNRGAAVIERSDEIADVLANRAQPLVGTNVQYFYHTGPLIEKAVDLGIPKETARQQLKKFALNYAATSPRTMTEQNLRNASLVTAKQQRGVELTDMIGPGGEGVNEKGYPMMINPGGIHKKLVDEAASDGLNFNTNPKPATFAENVSGNLAGVTADTHAIRAVFDAMNEIEPGSIPIEFIGGKNAKATKEMRAKYLADPSSLDAATMINDTLATQKIGGESVQTEYAIFSDIYKKVAQRLGVQPAEAQSLSWFANGKKTGLASEPKTIVQLIDERVDVTAKALDQPKDTVFKKFMQGSIPLLSVGGLTLLDTGAMQSITNENENGGSILPDAGVL